MGKNKPRIGIFAMGQVPHPVTKGIAVHLSDILDLSTKIFPPLEHPQYAFEPIRGQYEAGAIINTLELLHFSNISKVIAVVSVDLFVPVFTHVFGEAREGGTVAIVSLFRLQNRHRPDQMTPPPRALERVTKVAIHELCHLYELHHCEDRRCLMHFSSTIEELDQTPMQFCNYCIRYFQTAIG